MLTAETARERTHNLNLSAGCGISRPIEDRLRDVACDLLRVQAETLEFVQRELHSPNFRGVLRASLKDTHAELKKLEAPNA